MSLPLPRGRATGDRRPSRFERLAVELDPAALDDAERRCVPTQVFVDASSSVLSANDSPDVPFRYSVNPYRGCEHGCSYCYARPGHEYLGFGPGLDFETKIVAKPEAPRLLSEAFQGPSWTPEVVVLSGSTDPYQPVERRLRITRGLLGVFLAHRNPVAVITKNALVTRDIDLLGRLAERRLVHVRVSVTTLRDEVCAAMEPRTSRPAARLRAIERLAEAGVPVTVNVAPVIPGLTDEEVPSIIAAAAAAGATSASTIPVRLPGPVAPLFESWLRASFPDRADRVLNRIRAIRGGALNDARFGARMRAGGVWGEVYAQAFASARRRHGLDGRPPDLSTHEFRPLRHGQGGLFDDLPLGGAG